MKTMIRAGLFALLFVLATSACAWAQPGGVQPVATYDMRMSIDASLVNASSFDRTFGTVGYTAASVYVRNTACADPLWIRFLGGITATTATSVGYSSNANLSIPAGSETTFVVSPLQLFTRVRILTNGANCNSTVHIVFTTTAMTSIVEGYRDVGGSANGLRPVFMGGRNYDNFTIVPLGVDSQGGVKMSSLDAVPSAAGEVLIDVVPTLIPGTGIAEPDQNYVVVQNMGPQPITCGLSGAGAANGLSLNTNAGASFAARSLPVYCIAPALQVAGAGTRYVVTTQAHSIKLFGGGGPTSMTVSNLRVAACGEPVAYQLNKLAPTTITGSSSGAWRLIVQNLGDDEVLVSSNAAPTEANSQRIQAGGDVFERDWVGATAKLILKSDAGTSPQVSPKDVRVTICTY